MRELTAEQSKRVEENIGLAYFAAAKFWSYHVRNTKLVWQFRLEDLKQVAALALCEASSYYNPELYGKFSGYSWIIISQRLHEYYNKNKKHGLNNISGCDLFPSNLEHDKDDPLEHKAIDRKTDIEAEVIEKSDAELIREYMNDCIADHSIPLQTRRGMLLLIWMADNPDYSKQKLADTFGISKPCLYDSVAAARKLLQEKFSRMAA